jgi:hypothetical protein
MSIRTTMLCFVQALLITYAAFVFVSGQFNPLTWPDSARFTFVFTSLGIYVLNLVIKNDNSK